MVRYLFILVFILTACASHEEKQATAEATDPVLTPYFAMVDALANDDFAKAKEAGKELNEIEISDGVTKALKSLGRLMFEAKSFEDQRYVLYQLGVVLPLYIKQASLHRQELYKFSCPRVLEGKAGTWFSKSKKTANPFFGNQSKECITLEETIAPVQEK